ncbi:MAG: 50S ribosomal protein L24 [Cyclobacteriaceae bacterium]|nr:50S ribosomal protein L24 [Cyclobacteriaceae bacterium]MCK5207668.1 50S ribosomal protein L24 [Cyclobacteriaceae bacterium]MCK5281447.1 50S ribosomal protein L24 [Cyclobacteriaceae bacterium]MCK5470017.1 50S ribosomal protein L24 [Cyclobacteriaceae bacterium]MCK5704876.1 50S ribosomal protein L24 [Cyclobacteriaceae bacterium]
MTKKVKRGVKLHIRKGDTAIVIAGNDKGKKGKVLEVIIAKSRAIIEGVNMITKHVKPSANNPEGGIEKTEAPIHISNIMVIDPSNGEPTKVGRKLNDEGKLQRLSKKTGELIKNG